MSSCSDSSQPRERRFFGKEDSSDGRLVPLRGEFACGFGKYLRVQVDIGLAGCGAHQGHIVERGKKDAAVRSVEMEEAL